MTTTWTAVFTLSGVADGPADLAESVNGFAGKALLEKLRPSLASRGWMFGEPFAEDFGWYSDLSHDIEGKSVPMSLVGAPEGDTTPDGSAEDDRWRVVIGMDLGFFPKTKASRTATLADLARDTEAACRDQSATAFEWENGPFAGPV